MELTNYIYSLRGLMQIKRYQNKKKLYRRTIIDHVWSTAKIAHILAYWHEVCTGEKVDISELLERAIFSGTIKLFTGEIQGNTKTATPEIEQAIREAEALIFEDKYRKLIPEILDKEDIKRKVLYSRDSSLEGRILRVASLIDTTLECMEEISLNNTMYYEYILKESILGILNQKIEVGEWYVNYCIPEKHQAVGEPANINTSNPLIMEFVKTFPEFIKKVRGLMEIERYQNVYRNKVRNVAEHEWSVAIISYCLAKKIELTGVAVNMGDLLQTAICHDDIEMISGDILSKTKRVTMTLEKEIEKVEKLFFDNEIAKILPSAKIEDFRKRMLNPKDGTVEGLIISASDVIDTMYEAIEEINLFNSVEFGGVYQSAIDKLSQMEGSLPILKEFNANEIPEKVRLKGYKFDI